MFLPHNGFGELATTTGVAVCKTAYDLRFLFTSTAGTNVHCGAAAESGPQIVPCVICSDKVALFCFFSAK